MLIQLIKADHISQHEHTGTSPSSRGLWLGLAGAPRDLTTCLNQQHPGQRTEFLHESLLRNSGF
jgi:hypothetical protein